MGKELGPVYYALWCEVATVNSTWNEFLELYGKKPSRIPKETRSVHDLRQLQEKLRKSIQDEAFEEAARLRDEIAQALEKIKKGKRPKSE